MVLMRWRIAHPASIVAVCLLDKVDYREALPGLSHEAPNEILTAISGRGVPLAGLGMGGEMRSDWPYAPPMPDWLAGGTNFDDNV